MTLRTRILYAEKVGPRLAIGWTMGTLVSALGVYLSLKNRFADRRDHRVHLRPGVDYDGADPYADAAPCRGCRARAIHPRLLTGPPPLNPAPAGCGG
jgi:hypothetical protein